MSKRIIIDSHAHFAIQANKNREENNVGRSKQAESVLRDLVKLKRTVGVQDDLIDGKNLLGDYMKCMQRNNITMAWVHQLSFQEVFGYEVLSNAQIAAAINQYPQQLKGFASVDPRKGKAAIDELESAIIDLGLHGFKLNPNDYGGFFLNDREKLYPLYEKCCELNIPVSVHTGLTPGSIFRMKYNYPLLLDDVAVDFPELTLIVEHMGFPWNDLCYYMVARHENMYVTVTATANILIHQKPILFKIELSKMIAQIGSERILWGSDWTVTPNIEEVLHFFHKVKFPLPMKLMMGIKNVKASDLENILGLNALRILA